MKNLKYLLLPVLIVLFSCSSNDNNMNTTPTTLQASGMVNWASFNKNNTNITSLVTFSGQPASTYTIRTIKGDKVDFQFNIGNKTNLKVRRELVFLYIRIDSPRVADTQFLESLTYNPDPNYQDLEGNLGFTIGASAPENYDGKFDMYFRVLEDGVALPDIYVVDPKITIRPSR